MNLLLFSNEIKSGSNYHILHFREEDIKHQTEIFFFHYECKKDNLWRLQNIYLRSKAFMFCIQFIGL